jgi:EAL domain-containing protein (putative c-di-GMP-specific phosphodiesterase class I)
VPRWLARGWAPAAVLLVLDLASAYLLASRQWALAAVTTFGLLVVSQVLLACLRLSLRKLEQSSNDHGDLVERYREVQKALEDGSFELHYQPEVSLKARQVRALEVLVRWRRLNGELLPPARFIPFAEEVGLIRPIGTWILREACTQLATWRETLPAAGDLQISVNVSFVQLDDPKLVSVVQSALRDAGLPPEALILEVTESGLVADPKVFRVMLRQIQDLGVKVALDDFGTGYASINYLSAFKFDYVKLDRSFIAPLETPYGDPDLVAGLVTLAKSLGSEVIAEGVSSAQLEYVCRSLGCDWGQGYHFSPPIAAEEIELLLGESPLALIA